MNNSKLITNRERHEYFKSIYPALHPNNDEETRTYRRPKPNFDFVYKNMNLIYSKDNSVDFSKSKSVFKSFNYDEEKKDKNIHDQISFYLMNSIVPGYSHEGFNQFKKERYQSPEIKDSKSYDIDKWYFRRKDDRTVYYEKFFLEKEIDKLRKKNKNEAKDSGGASDKPKEKAKK